MNNLQMHIFIPPQNPSQRLTSLSQGLLSEQRPTAVLPRFFERVPALLAAPHAAAPGAVTRGLSGTVASPLSIKNN